MKVRITRDNYKGKDMIALRDMGIHKGDVFEACGIESEYKAVSILAPKDVIYDSMEIVRKGEEIILAGCEFEIVKE